MVRGRKNNGVVLGNVNAPHLVLVNYLSFPNRFIVRLRCVGSKNTPEGPEHLFVSRKEVSFSFHIDLDAVKVIVCDRNLDLKRHQLLYLDSVVVEDILR